MSNLNDWGALQPLQKMSEILKALKDPIYFFQSPFFLGPSVGHIIRGEKAKLIAEFYGGYSELDLLGGMRSGKSSLIIGCVAYETFLALNIDYVKRHNLAPGTPLFGILCSAKEETAIDTLFTPYLNYLEQSPYFTDQIFDRTKKAIAFPEKNFVVKPIASSAATESGRTCKVIGIDEFGKIQQTESLRGAKELYRAFTKSTESLKGDGHRFIAGSIVSANDMLLELVQTNKTVPQCLTKIYPTWELNPEITRESLENEYIKDPIGAARDFGCEVYASDYVFFRDPDVIEFDKNKPNALLQLAEGVKVSIDPNYRYALAGDPSLRHCSFGIALSHKDHDTFITDGVYRFQPHPPKKDIDPLSVKDFFLRAIKEIPVRWVVFDTWNYPETIAEIRRAGVAILNHTVKSEDYKYYKDLCYSKKQVCCSFSPVESEFKSLIVKGNKIDHPRGGSDDCSDAVVNSVWVLRNKASEHVGYCMVKKI